MEEIRKKIILLCDALSDAVYLGMAGNEHLADEDTDELAKKLTLELADIGKIFRRKVLIQQNKFL